MGGNWIMVCYFLMLVTSLQDFGQYHVDMGLHLLLKALGFVGLSCLSFHTYIGKFQTLTISKNNLCRPWQDHRGTRGKT